MSDVTIESIAIEITAAADSADKALERLSKNLETLRNVCASGLEGANKVADGLKKIAEAANYFNSVDEGKMKSVASALRAIGKIKSVPNLTPFARSISKVVEATNSVSTEQMTSFVTNMRSFSSAMQPLSSLSGLGDLSGAINALKGLPKVAKGLSQMNLGTFARQMQQITAAVQPFVTQMQNLSSSFTNMPAPIQQAVAGIVNYNTAVNNADDRTRSLGKSLKLLNFTAMYLAIRKVVNILGQFITASNEYVENLNLFTVTMGEATNEALDFANTVNKVMGIDVSQWIKNQGVFKQMTSGFGMVEEKANLVSKNLTQLGYDISSYFNIRVEDAMQKLQAGLTGEIEPLRRLGYSLEAATLQQVAHAHGIEMNINNMSQAQKAQLRYIAIMEQSTNAMGDMARTIESPANQIRILESRIQTLKRAIGDSLMPIVSAALPYVTAFVQILGEFFRDVAEFMGFELPKFDYSDVVTKGNEDIASSFDDATKASKEFKGTLASIDQLNIIGSKSEKGAGTGNNFGADLDLNLPSYDFLGNLKEETSGAYNTIKNFVQETLPWIEALGIAIGTIFIGKKVYDLIDALPKLGKVVQTVGGMLTGMFGPVAKILSGIVGGLAAGAASGILLNSGIKNLITGTGKLGNNIAKVASGAVIAGGAIALFVKLGNPVGAVITGIGAAIGIVSGIIAGNIENMKKYNEELSNTITYADNGGISLQGLTDGFKSYFDSITDNYDDILENTAAFKDNEEKIKNATTEVGNLIDKYTLLDRTMTAEDAQALADNVKIIGDGIKNNLGEGTRGIVEQLQTTFSNFATSLGADVDDMVTKFYLLESMGDSALATTRKRADELVAGLQSGNLSAEEQKQKFTELQDTIKAMGTTTNVGSKEEMSFERAIQEMSTAKINFDKPEEIEKQVTELTSLADQARSSITTAYDDQTWQLAQLKERYSTMINLDTGNTVKFDFDKAMGAGAFDKLFETTQAVYDKAKETNLSRVDIGQTTYLSMLQSQLEENEQRFGEQKFRDKGGSFTSWLDNGGFLGRGDDWYELAVEEYKGEYRDLNSELYDLIGGSLEDLNLTPQGKEAAKMLVEGMSNGAIESKEDFNAALDALARGGLDALRAALDEHSPSKKGVEIGGYLTEGLAIGILSEKPKLLSALDDIAKSIYERMSSISFKIPMYTEEDVDKATKAPWRSAWGGVQSTSSPVRNDGADPQALTHASQIWSANGQPMDVNVNVQSYVELDGEQVGTAVSRYQQQQMAYSNGR